VRELSTARRAPERAPRERGNLWIRR
jgi:hypothetical protein